MADSFSDNLKAARLAQGFSQVDVAKSIGVAKSTYSLYESGKRSPDIKTIKIISRVLNTSADILLGVPDALEQNRLLRPDQIQLLNDYNLLNDDGRREAIKRVNELTLISQYKGGAS